MTVGYRFHPTDEELISHYLKLKMQGRDSQVQHVIPEVDFYKREPWELRALFKALSKVDSDDPEWFFFCARGNKYPNSNRNNRKTEAGFWKVTGKERLIKARASKAVIGKKRTLVFHEGSNPGKRTDWVMHEYNSVDTLPNERAFVICRLKKKTDEKNIPNGDEGEPGSYLVSDFENHAVHDPFLEVHSDSDANLESLFWQPSLGQPLDYNSSTLQSPTNTEQRMNFPFANGSSYDFPFANGSSYDCYGMQPSFEANEPEVDPAEFLNSILADEVEYGGEINMLQLVHGGVSSDTDTDVDHGRRHSLNSGSFLDGSVGAKEYRQMRMVRIPSGTSKHEQSRKDKNVSLHNQFSTKGASSVSLNPDSFLSQECSVTESQQRSIDVTTRTGVSSRRIQLQRPTTAVSGDKQASQSSAVDLPQKEKSSAESKDDKKTVQNKSASYESSDRNWKSFFIFVEESSPVSSIPSPPSVYFFNALLGMFLFVVFVRELLLYGNWW
ncbi:hypothetical protein FNV43_RR18048 [Rhamnella rubrinervis]|uniref:NAC domain-containing protein n=1 Tax=Rhamnella rubrinervis TaxID=2594499 RepID=A0A8K0E5H3_9ROSA|nr:hypothetical protein FNV43_RR18048 [Rhamnella rubrinervis]